MSAPTISIITPNFNKGYFVKDCIQSVIQQTFSDWEMLFVDDFSTDGSDHIAREMALTDSRIRFFKNEGIKGASSCRNQALKRATGEFVMFLDSDDLLISTCLANRLADLRFYTDVDYCVYPMGLFHRQIGDSNVICNIPTSEKPLHRFLNRDIAWLISGPIWKRTTLQDLGGFDDDLHSQQDYDLHIRALIKGVPFKYFHREPDTYYRQDVKSLPRLNSQNVEHFQFRFEMILRHVDLLKEAGKLNKKEKLLVARYLLDLAQMMRWHIVELGKGAKDVGKYYWSYALKLGLVDSKSYSLGKKYLSFKHNMKWNYFPLLQAKLEKIFRSKLDDLIFTPSSTYCKVTLQDYAE